MARTAAFHNILKPNWGEKKGKKKKSKKSAKNKELIKLTFETKLGCFFHYLCQKNFKFPSSSSVLSSILIVEKKKRCQMLICKFFIYIKHDWCQYSPGNSDVSRILNTFTWRLKNDSVWTVQVPLLRPSTSVRFLTAFLRQVFSLTCFGFLSFVTAIPGNLASSSKNAWMGRNVPQC